MTRRPPSFPPASSPERRPSPPSAVAVIERGEESTATDRVSGGLTERLAERRRARRRLRMRAVAFAVAALVLVGLGGYVALASPVLALRTEEVTVTGTTQIVGTDDVMAVVAAQEGRPLLLIDTVELRDALREVVGVRDVTVRRDFPNGLEIVVEPRVPVATVQQDGSFVLLDGEGVELARTEQPAEGVPQVSVPVGSEETAASLEAVLTALDALPPDLLEQTTEASAATPQQVELTLASGSRVVWGSGEDSELKAEVLASLLQVIAAVYDVSAPLSPITR